MKALITGFDAFGGAAANPSGELVSELARAPLPAPFDTIEGLVLPTVYSDAAAALKAVLTSARPDLVLMFGLSARSTAYRLERFALNVADCPDPDNAGCVLEGDAVDRTGPPAYRTNLDVAAIARRCNEFVGHAPELSNHAGTFVCNFAYFTVLHEIARTAAHCQALFVHVPWSLPVSHRSDFSRTPLEQHVRMASALLRATGEAMTAGASAA